MNAVVRALVHQALDQKNTQPAYANKREVANCSLALVGEGVKLPAVVGKDNGCKPNIIVDGNRNVYDAALGAVSVRGDVAEELFNSKTHVVAELERHGGLLEDARKELLNRGLIAGAGAETPGVGYAVAHASPPSPSLSLIAHVPACFAPSASKLPTPEAPSAPPAIAMFIERPLGFVCCAVRTPTKGILQIAV